MRIVTFIVLLLVVSCSFGQSKYRKDFDEYWNTVDENFAYFDLQKTDWNKVKSLYQPIADTITSKSSFIQFLETVNNELYNGHISLNTNLPSSHRLIPTGADLWVEHVKNQFIITAIRQGFNAEQCGLRKGMVVTAYNGIPIANAVLPLLPKSVAAYDDRMYEYAGNLLLAGTHDVKRKITATVNGIEKTYYPDTIFNRVESNYATIIESRMMPGNIGYIRVNNSLGDNDLIAAFDHALDSLWNSNGFIIDLRETPSGGNSTVARAIMSRFISKEMPYQKHSIPAEEKQFGVKRAWIELVYPRGKIYMKPLVVLVNRWTGSMGEGIAIGFDAMKRAVIVGDKMAGLLGASYSFTLPETGIGFTIPAEKLFHVNGMRRENFVPQWRESDYKKQMAIALKVLSTNMKRKK